MDIGKRKMRNVGCAITEFNQPIGKYFGNILEMREIYQFLNGDSNNEIEDIILNFGANILLISGIEKELNKARKSIKDNIENGKALKSFEKLITGRGGNIEFIKKDIEVKNKIPIISNCKGFIKEIDVNKVRQLAKYLDAIRVSSTDKIDIGAGIEFNKKIGDFVSPGDILMYIYTNNDTKINEAVDLGKKLIDFSDKKVVKRSRIHINVNNL